MVRQSILIVGGNGFVGSAIARALAPHHTVHCTHQSTYTPIPNVTFHLLNQVTDKELCRAVANKATPNVIIYCAGSNEPSKYEQDQTSAQVVFSGGLGAMLTATEVMKPKMIYISSDFVFAGSEGNYAENDTPLSFSQFGKAKVGGENFLKSRSNNHIIIRCAPLMGRGPIDHPSWIDQWREQLILDKPLKVSSKTFHNPAPIQSLISAIQHALTVDMKNKTLHIGGLAKVSMIELAGVFAQYFGFNPKLIEANDEQVNTINDYSLNFTETLNLLQAEPLLLQQCFNLIE